MIENYMDFIFNKSRLNSKNAICSETGRMCILSTDISAFESVIEIEVRLI